MKRIIAALCALLAALSLASCGGGDKEAEKETETTAETTEALTMPKDTLPPETKADTTAVTTQAGEIGNEAAVEKAREFLGETDPASGNKYNYSYESRLSDNGVDYYKIRVSQFIEDGGHSSLCGYLLVSPDGQSVQKFGW